MSPRCRLSNPRTLALLAASLLLAGCAAAASADEPPAGGAAAATPKLRFGENEVDYGLLRQGEVIERELVIHNDGAAPLAIRQAIPSCGCTTVHAFPREIVPGGSGTVRFEVDSRKIHPGDTRKRIKFETNDPAQEQAAFYFTAEVLALYRSDPPKIELSGLFDRAKSARIRLIGTTQHGFELLGARSRGGQFEITDFVEVGIGTYELELTAAAAAKPESLRDPLDLQIRLVDGATIEVGQWVDIAHLDPVEVLPEGALQFDNKETDALLAAGAAPVTKRVVLRTRDPERPFHVLSARLEDFPEGAFETAVETVAEGSQYAVRVTLPAYRDEAFLLGKLIIETDAAVEPVRTLHLRAKFGRKR